MGYSKLNADRAYALAPTFAALQALEPGKHLVVECRTAEELQRTRLDIYTWMFEKGVKGAYRLRTLRPTELMVTRQAMSPPMLAEVPQAGLERVKDFVVDYLLQLDEPGALQRIAQAVESELLTEAEGRRAEAEWRRLMQ